MPALVRSAVLSTYKKIATHVALDPYDMLRDCGISQEALTNRNLKLPLVQVTDLLERSAKQSRATNFGLQMAIGRKISLLGELGAAVRDLRNLRSIFDKVSTYIHYHNEAIYLRLEDTPIYTSVVFDTRFDDSTRSNQFVEHEIGATVSICRSLLGEEWTPHSTHFLHGKPTDLSLHLRHFGPRLIFDAEFDGVVIKADDMLRRLGTADTAMAELTEDFESAVAQDRKLHVSHSVMKQITTLLPQSRCTIDQVAKNLHLETRTLQRQLSAERTSFSSLVDAAREMMLDNLMVNLDRQAAEVGWMLGFSHASAFSRWHKNRFGMSFATRREALIADGHVTVIGTIPGDLSG